MSATAPALEIRDLQKSYPGIEALKGINLTVPLGGIWGLLGPNGSGKTTLLKCVMGLLRPDQGEILILGQEPSRCSKTQTAFVPEIDSFYDFMTVQRLLGFLAAFYEDWQQERVEELLDLMELEPAKRIRYLSRGMRARLRTTLALIRQAPLVLLDEPFSGIDPVSRDKVMEGIVRRFKGEKQTFVISTHAIGDAEPLFDGVVFLAEGVVNLQGDAEELRFRHGKSINDLFKEVFG